jgi:hypothetical protein
MKLFRYILVCAFLFSFLDWKVIQFTRLQNRDWLDWMHAHEQEYGAITRAAELVLCTPALALKPIFLESMKRVEASQEEQDAITHAPLPDSQGFYHLPRRGESWTFVPWLAWFLYWLVPSVIWWMGARRFFRWQA